MEGTVAQVQDPKSAEMDEERLAALRQDPEVIVHRRTTHEPYKPVIQVTERVNILDLLDRSPDEGEAGEHPPR